MSQLKLSKDQLRVVNSDALAIAVVAGAGSGKTEVLSRRIERLLAESESENYRILAVSFTVKAADELKQRLKRRLGDLFKRVDACTVHEFALDLLRQHGTRLGLPPEPEIYSRNEDRIDLLDRWLAQEGISFPTDPAEALREIDLARAKMRTAPFLKEWRAALEAERALDFPAMLEQAIELARGPWLGKHLRRLYEHVAVDEAQNLSKSQYELLTAVIGSPEEQYLRAVLIGDERQSIVGFAGADSTLINKFVSDYKAEKIELHTNYRSAKEIIEVGRRVASALDQPDHQLGTEFPARGLVELRDFLTESEEGEAVALWIDELRSKGLPKRAIAPGEATSLKLEDIAVLARAAASLQPIRSALEDYGIQSAIASTADEWVTSPAGRTAVEMIAFRAGPERSTVRRRLTELAESDDEDWEKLDELVLGASEESVARIAGLPSDSPAEFIDALGSVNLDEPDWLGDFGQIQGAWSSFLEETRRSDRTFANFRFHISRCQRGDKLSEGVRLLTVHKAQGREFKAVCIVACNDGQFPDFRSKDDVEKSLAELRTFYVAVTRPSRLLLLTRARQRDTRYGPRSTEASRFLEHALPAARAMVAGDAAGF